MITAKSSFLFNITMEIIVRFLGELLFVFEVYTSVSRKSFWNGFPFIDLMLLVFNTYINDQCYKLKLNWMKKLIKPKYIQKYLLKIVSIAAASVDGSFYDVFLP